MNVPFQYRHAISTVLYGLFFVSSTEFDGYSPTVVSNLLNTYGKEKVEDIAVALEWLQENPDADLENWFPEYPHNNDTIHTMAAKALASLKSHSKPE